METKLYNTEGKEVSTVTLPDRLFGLPWNADLVHQVATSMLANRRSIVAHTKNRGEVRGGGKKPWKQKGTGRARHGSRRSPIWRGGGTTFGPRNEKRYEKKVNKKMVAKALFTVLSRKAREGEVLLVDNVHFAVPKTAEAKTVLKNFSNIKGFESMMGKGKNAALFALPNADQAVVKSFRNFGNIAVEESRNLNPLDLLTYKYLVLIAPEESMRLWEGKLTSTAKKETAAPTPKKRASARKTAPRKIVRKKKITR